MNSPMKNSEIVPFFWVSLLSIIMMIVNSHVVVSTRVLGQNVSTYWFIAAYAGSGESFENNKVPKFSFKRHWILIYCAWRFLQGGISFGSEAVWF